MGLTDEGIGGWQLRKRFAKDHGFWPSVQQEAQLVRDRRESDPVGTAHPSGRYKTARFEAWRTCCIRAGFDPPPTLDRLRRYYDPRDSQGFYGARNPAQEDQELSTYEKLKASGAQKKKKPVRAVDELRWIVRYVNSDPGDIPLAGVPSAEAVVTLETMRAASMESKLEYIERFFKMALQSDSAVDHVRARKRTEIQEKSGAGRPRKDGVVIDESKALALIDQIKRQVGT